MLIPNHPHDERLAALASADADATADEALTSHVAACDRCTEAVTELGALRASLGELPDLRPHRPLRLVPEVADAPAPGGSDRLIGWVRRVFAPVVTAGAALAMVGLVGTAAPLLSAGAAGAGPFQEVGDQLEAAGGAGGEVAAPASSGRADQGDEEPNVTNLETFTERGTGTDNEALTTLPAERSPWPMVLFSGIALVIFALLLRWIVVPRAG
jgi:hypothetical protein